MKRDTQHNGTWYRVSFKPSVANKPFMLSVIMLCVANKTFMLSVIILSVVAPLPRQHNIVLSFGFLLLCWVLMCWVPLGTVSSCLWGGGCATWWWWFHPWREASGWLQSFSGLVQRSRSIPATGRGCTWGQCIKYFLSWWWGYKYKLTLNFYLWSG